MLIAEHGLVRALPELQGAGGGFGIGPTGEAQRQTTPSPCPDRRGRPDPGGAGRGAPAAQGFGALDIGGIRHFPGGGFGGREPRAMGFCKMTARPRHKGQNEYALDDFKEISEPGWSRSGRRSRPARTWRSGGGMKPGPSGRPSSRGAGPGAAPDPRRRKTNASGRPASWARSVRPRASMPVSCRHAATPGPCNGIWTRYHHRRRQTPMPSSSSTASDGTRLPGSTVPPTSRRRHYRPGRPR